MKLLRSTLVNTTLPENGAAKDRPTARSRYRLLCYVFELSFLASTVPGLIAGNKYNAARTNQDLADKNMQLLYVSAPSFMGINVNECSLIEYVGMLALE